ncbi:MAG TPA: 30S ribosomal protein S17 [Candidatus Paceibacterota bacterium]
MAKEKEKNSEVKKKKVFQGTVVSDKMKDTVIVLVERYVKHPTYKKYLRRTKRFQAHDSGNVHKVGEKVQIEETRPLSKNKHFRVL